MRSTKSQSTSKSRSSQDQKLKQLVYIAAILFLIAAIISLYVAWKDLSSPGGTEDLIV